MTKRLFDLCVALAGLALLAPLLLLIALIIRLESPGPVFFRQERVGRFGKHFRIHKFRTMCRDAAALGPQITAGGDRRITRVGAVLRKYKLDELPQLLDVLWGDMSLVGPRPEVPHYVQYYPAEVRELVFSVRPGITDQASILFSNEAQLLAEADDAERQYIEQILPQKWRLYERYVREQSFFGDIMLIGKTLGAIFLAGK